MTVFIAEQQLRHHAVFHHFGRAPFRGHHHILAEMPPEVISKLLGAAFDLPPAAEVESLVVHQEDAAWAITVRIAERADINAVRSAMNGVRARVTGFFRKLFRFDHFDNLRILRIRFDVEHIHAGRAQPRHDQVAAFGMGMGCVWTKAGATGVPAEMMQLIARHRHISLANDLGVAFRFGVGIDHGHRVGFLAVRIEGDHISQVFRRCLHRHPR